MRSQRSPRVRSRALLAGLVALLGLASNAAAQPMITLAEGDIIVLDQGADTVFLVDPGSGNESVIFTGPQVLGPKGVAVTPEGFLFVSDSVSEILWRIDPFDGTIVQYFEFIPPPGRNPDPAAALADPTSNWDVLVLDGEVEDIFRIDPALPGFGTTEFNLIGTRFPLGMARDPTDGRLVVSDSFTDSGFSAPGFHRVDPEAGTQQVIALSEMLENIQRLAVKSNGDIVFTEFGGNGVPPGVFRVPAGTTDIVDYGSFHDDFTFPAGIALESDDSVLVTDAGTGQLWRLTNGGDSRELVNGDLVVPIEVMVVPPLPTRRHDEFLISEADPGGTTGEIYRANSLTDSRAPIAATGGAMLTEPRAMAFEHPDDTLDDGAIYVIDGPASVVHRDLVTGTQTVISSGGDFGNLVDIAVEFGNPLGSIVVIDRDDDQVIRVDPVAMTQSVVGALAFAKPTSLVVDGSGSLIIAANELGDDGFTGDDSGLFRMNPLNGDVVHFDIVEILPDASVVQLKFLDPFALARDSNGDLLLIDAGDPNAAIDPRIFRIIGADTGSPTISAIQLPTPVGPVLADAVAMLIDENRDAVIAFDVDEPERVEVVESTSETLMIGGSLNLATDILFEDLPPPGDPTDSDSDGVPDGFDNCPDVSNGDQQDSDGDGFGDVCQIFDIDLDGWSDFADNCTFYPNNDQADVDEDFVGDVCDNCPDDANQEQADFNGNGVGDACEDSDADTVLDVNDNCPDTPNANQDDGDGDGVGDDCDNCPDDFNPTQSDLNEDGEGDACQSGDSDDDGIPDEGGPAPCATGVFVNCDDNCPGDFNPDQTDSNEDGFGNVCQDAEAGPDDDFDGWPNSQDNCPTLFNPDQSDLNEDGEGDICQSGDSDGDGIPDDGGPATCLDGETVNCDDNCPDDFNPTQSDLNEDGEGDACQSGDLDNDGIPDDGGPAACMDGMTVNCDDNCPIDFNPGQEDANGDQIGNPCQPDDIDGDGLPDDEDNCPYYPNTEQEDLDSDGIGDFCDNNTDADGLVDVIDNCPTFSNFAGVGSCFAGPEGQACTVDAECDTTIEGTCSLLTLKCTVGAFGADCAVDDDCDVDVVGICSTDQEDVDTDGVGDLCDNCVSIPNGLVAGTCLVGLVHESCFADSECDDGSTEGECSLDQEDADSDGSGDLCDNCVEIANGPDAYNAILGPVSQCDTDSDGYGNACDGDLTGDDVTTGADNSVYLAALGDFTVPPAPREADFNCDGFVSGTDNPFYLMQLSNFSPGPSGWECAGMVPCPPAP